MVVGLMQDCTHGKKTKRQQQKGTDAKYGPLTSIQKNILYGKEIFYSLL